MARSLRTDAAALRKYLQEPRRFRPGSGEDIVGQAIRVLAVDDDKLVRMNLSLLLGREGLIVDVASTAAEARDLLCGHHYELVLTDIGLPDGDGMEILDAAKMLDPATQVILVTGSQTALTPEKATAAGARSLVLKPFKLADLLDEVRQALRGLERGDVGVARPARPGPQAEPATRGDS